METRVAVLILRPAFFLALLLIPAVHARAQMRVVAVGDSHGAYPEFVATLQRVGLIGGNRQWIGGSSVLVQTGDVIDRGRESRNCLDLLLARLKVQYMVAAHTVRPKFEIMPRFDNHVFLIDTGMLKEVYGGRGSALEFREGGITAYYTDGEPQVLVEPGGRPGSPASSLDKNDSKPKP